MKNTDIVADFKVELVKEFFRMKEFIEEKQTQEWKEARELSKGYTKEFNNAVNEFIEYATASGSSKPKMYFIHFNKLVNKVMGIKDGQRDLTGKKELRNQTFIMELVENMIKEGINNGIYYKDIYEDCKAKLDEMLKFMPMLRLN
jgi:hypothetical protein